MQMFNILHCYVKHCSYVHTYVTIREGVDFPFFHIIYSIGANYVVAIDHLALIVRRHCSFCKVFVSF